MGTLLGKPGYMAILAMWAFIWKQKIPGRGKSKCKGPKAGLDMSGSRSSKEATVATAK